MSQDAKPSSELHSDWHNTIGKIDGGWIKGNAERVGNHWRQGSLFKHVRSAKAGGGTHFVIAAWKNKALGLGVELTEYGMSMSEAEAYELAKTLEVVFVMGRKSNKPAWLTRDVLGTTMREYRHPNITGLWVAKLICVEFDGEDDFQVLAEQPTVGRVPRELWGEAAKVGRHERSNYKPNAKVQLLARMSPQLKDMEVRKKAAATTQEIERSAGDERRGSAGCAGRGKASLKKPGTGTVIATMVDRMGLEAEDAARKASDRSKFRDFRKRKHAGESQQGDARATKIAATRSTISERTSDVKQLDSSAASSSWLRLLAPKQMNNAAASPSETNPSKLLQSNVAEAHPAGSGSCKPKKVSNDAASQHDTNPSKSKQTNTAAAHSSSATPSKPKKVSNAAASPSDMASAKSKQTISAAAPSSGPYQTKPKQKRVETSKPAVARMASRIDPGPAPVQTESEDKGWWAAMRRKVGH